MRLRRSAVVLLLWLACGFSACASTLSIDVGASWDFSLRVGVEWRIHPHFGIKADVGTSIAALLQRGFGLAADLMGTVYFTRPESRFHAGLGIGIPDFIFVAAEGGAAMCSFGAALLAGYRFSDLFTLRARLGGGYPVFYEDRRWETREIGMPLGLWPDIMIEGLFRILDGRTR